MGKTTKEVIELDYYAENNQALFQKCLRKIKPFENEEGSEIKLESLEKYVGIACRKYGFVIDYFNVMFFKKERRNLYSCTPKKIVNGRKVDILDVYGCTMYEMYAKLSILFYSEIKKIKGD